MHSLIQGRQAVGLMEQKCLAVKHVEVLIGNMLILAGWFCPMREFDIVRH